MTKEGARKAITTAAGEQESAPGPTFDAYLGNMAAPTEFRNPTVADSPTSDEQPQDLLSADLFGYESMLTPAEWDVVRRTREFMATHVAPIAQDCWARAEFPFQIIEPLAQVGIIGQAYGLNNAPAASQLLTGFVGLEIARVDPSIATFIGVHSGLAMGTIVLCGSPEQQDRWLPAMQRMELIGAFGLTEPDGGSDVAGGMRTTAKRTGDGWVINGAKRWIGNATFADLTISWARDVDDDQVTPPRVVRRTRAVSLNELALCSRLASLTRQSVSTMSAFCTVRSDALFSILVATKPGVSFSMTNPLT